MAHGSDKPQLPTIHDLTPDERAAMWDAHERQMWYLIRTSHHVCGNRLNQRQLLHGIINAIEDSGLDFASCESQADVSALVLAALSAGMNKLGAKRRDD